MGMDQFQKDLLDAHNEHRRDVGDPELQWSDDLAKEAQEWADRMASEEYLHHATAEERLKHGENLALSGHENYTGREATEQWWSEIKNFHHNNCVQFDPKTGHFTQLIWKSTTHVGAGMATDKNGKHYVCARYHPAGNMQGTFKENIPRHIDGVSDDEDDEESIGGTIDQNEEQKEVETPKEPEVIKRQVELGTVQHEAVITMDGSDENIRVSYVYEEMNTTPENDKICKTVEVTSSNIPHQKVPEYYLRKDDYLCLGKTYQLTHYLIY